LPYIISSIMITDTCQGG